METILNIFPNGEAGRRFVVTCYQRLELSGAMATPIEKPLPARWLDGLLKQVVLTPGKGDVDVVLARLPAEDSTRVWLQDSAAEPRPITEAVLGPSASARFRTLADHAARQWAIAGGLCAIEARWEGATWQPQVCAIPASVPLAYFSVAPPEQRFARLAETLTVWVASSTARTCSQVRLRRVAAWVANAVPARPIEVSLDTFVIDPDGQEAIVFWRGVFTQPEDASMPTVIAEPVVDSPIEDEETNVGDAAPKTELAPIPTAEMVIGRADFRQTLPSMVAGRDPALPFRSSSPPPAAPLVVAPVPARATPWDMDDPETQSEEPDGLHLALPFRASGTQVSVPQAAMPRVVPPPAVPVMQPALPRASYQLDSDQQRLGLGRNIASGSDESAAVAPPLVIESPLTAEPEPETQPKPPPEITLENVAVLDAELQMGVTGERSSLADLGLGLADVAAHQTRWAEAIATDSKQGKQELQRRYDAAFLVRLEELRERPVSTGEYARVVVSAERLNTAEVLSELGLPERSLLVLTRVFSERTASSPDLRREVRARIQEARRAS